MALVAMFCASPAYAILINYQLTGTIGAGTIDLGSGPVFLDGRSFTATGMIVSEVDLSPLLTSALFSATTIYDFGAAGSFVTDPGMDFFFQAENPVVTQLGLVNLDVTGGLISANVPSFMLFADPNVPKAFGSVSPNIPDVSSPRTQTNMAGGVLTIVSASVATVSTTAMTVPEPTTLLLLGFGLAGLRFSRPFQSSSFV